MIKTRRDFIARLLETSGAFGIALAMPRPAKACLYGKWKVRCPNGHDNMVDDGTCQHKCKNCRVQAFSGNDVTVVCRNGHPNRITTGAGDRDHITQHYTCPSCHTDCRLG